MDYLSPLRSELKLKILSSLLKGEKKIADLSSDLETRETTILHILKDFEELNLTTKTDGFYKLSTIGVMQAKIFSELLSTMDVIEKFKDFWLIHNLAEISPYLFSNVGALRDAVLLQAKASELGIVHKQFIEVVKRSKRIRGISPIFHPDFISLFGGLLDQGCTIELIINTDVLEKIMGYVDHELVKKYFKADSLKIFLRDDLKIALALTENSFSLGLFSLSGMYDDSMDLVSDSQEAIRWGEHLFDDLARTSKKISLD